MKLWRVFPFDPSAAQTDPGGALFRPHGGSGRIDNPRLYRTLYAAHHPECAIAETFGAFDIWDRPMLSRGPLPYALATLVVPARPPLCEMDDSRRLMLLGIRPTSVVRRNRKTTQAWAGRIFALKRHRGISWWSYYNPDWTSCGLWSLAGVAVANVEPLTLETPALRVSAAAIVRLVLPR